MVGMKETFRNSFYKKLFENIEKSRTLALFFETNYYPCFNPEHFYSYPIVLYISTATYLSVYKLFTK